MGLDIEDRPVSKASRDFQVFAKPIGAACNLNCQYCYYLNKQEAYGKGEVFRMPDDILETYIVQHIEACPGTRVGFSWHGGEPTLLGIEYFGKIVALQRKHKSPDLLVFNGIQTNGTLLDEDWCRFLATEHFGVGLSLDGPKEMHDRYRLSRTGEPSHERAVRGFSLLTQHGVPCDVLCVVHAQNVAHPIEVYRFFKDIGARYIGFLPLVERETGTATSVSSRSVPAEALGTFLCSIFDEWISEDVGRMHVQLFDEAAAEALGQEHSLCIFRKECGDLPVIEHNGDFFSCDHFVDQEHRLGNIRETHLVELLESQAQRAFGQSKSRELPRWCRTCEVLAMCNGGCPKDRFLKAPDGENGLNYLCAGYKQFFKHCRPFLDQLAALARTQDAGKESRPVSVRGTPTEGRVKAGRNDPCPCGSGLKYKKCCGR